MSPTGEMKESATVQVMDTVELEITAVAGGERRIVAQYTGGDIPETLHADTYPTGFYQDRNARGRIKNQVSDSLNGTGVDKAAWERAWNEKTSEMVASKDEAKAELVPKNVRQLAEGTQSVYVTMGGDVRKWKITIEYDGRTGEIVLTHEDMASGGVVAVKRQMFKQFANSPEIRDEDWDSLKSFWLEQQQEVAVETMTETDRAVEGFVNKLSQRVTPHEDPESLATGDKETAWVDWDNTHGLHINGSAGIVNGVVWVRSELINDILNSMDSAPRVGELGGELGDRGYTVRGSENLQPSGGDTKERYWFFAPDKLGIKEMDVVKADEESGSETGGSEV